MNTLSVLLIAVGLSMDAFAVSITSGFTLRKRMHLGHALLIAVFFGGFQALMPVLGWFAGQWARVLISRGDHWISFLLLAGVGGKMIYEALNGKEFNERANPLAPHTILMLSVATSLDALAVGVSLSFLHAAILSAAAIIGITTFCFSLAGVYIGALVGHFFERKIEIAGGLILIGIGITILLQHMLSVTVP